jgi:virginiamycin A acetyltransferase
MLHLGKHSYCTGDRYEDIEDMDIQVGNYTSIAGGIKFIGGKHAPEVDRNAVSSYPFFEQYGLDYIKGISGGKVTIGSDVWIGREVTIREGVTIGDGAIIGMGAVVAKDVPAYAVSVGNPIQIKRFRFEDSVIERLLEICWWNWDDNKVAEAVPYMKEIGEFLQRYG